MSDTKVGGGDADQAIAGRYRRLRTLGHGAFGEVFEAQDELLLRRVAIKTLPGRRLAPVLATRALLREARMASRVGRSAVQIHDLVQTDGASWLVMELIEGGSVADIPQVPMAADRLDDLVASAVSGLAALHQKRIIHGDIHPGNLLVRDGTEVVYSDFGLARHAERRTVARAGARDWSAPEVRIRGTSTTSDVYSLALVLEWLCERTGRPVPSAVSMGRTLDPRGRHGDGVAFMAALAVPFETDVLPPELAAAAQAARDGRLTASAGLLTAAIRKRPADARPRRSLAYVRWLKGERQAAVWDLEAAIQLDPSDSISVVVLRHWRSELERGDRHR